MITWKPVIRTPEKRIRFLEGFAVLHPVMVEYWTDEKWSWVFSSELDILAGGDSPAEAELRFWMILLQKKLACLEWMRNGMERGIAVDTKMVDKMREII